MLKDRLRNRSRLWEMRLMPYSRTTRVQRRAVLCTRGEWHWSMNRKEKQTIAWEWLDSAPSVYVRFTLQGLKFGSNCSASHGYWDCLIALPYGVRSGTMIIFNLVGCKKFLYHACIDRCKSIMVNPTRIWKLKLEIKDLLFIAFQQINSRAFTSLACLVKGMLYTLRQVSLAEY